VSSVLASSSEEAWNQPLALLTIRVIHETGPVFRRPSSAVSERWLLLLRERWTKLLRRSFSLRCFCWSGSRKRSTSRHSPALMARSMAVKPSLVASSGRPPQKKSLRISSTSPRPAAMCRGVLPSRSQRLGSRPKDKNSPAFSPDFCLAAQCNALCPLKLSKVVLCTDCPFG